MPSTQDDPLAAANRRRIYGPAPTGAGPRPDQALLGGLILAMGSIWIAVPLLTLLADGRLPLPGLDTVASCILLAVGAGHVLWALNLLLRRQTLIIDRDVLLMSNRSLLGVRRWREPLAHYHGLRHRRERIRHRYGWRVVHHLELAHADPAKVVCLISTRDEDRLAACKSQWADRLGLPVWSADPSASPEKTADTERRRPERERLLSF